MKFFIVLSVLAFASASPIAQDDSVLRLFLGNIVNCVNSDIGLCLKEQALKATVRLNSARTFKLAEGVTIINNGPKEAKSLELPVELEERKKEVTSKLWESTSDLLNNSDLELNFNTGVSDEAEPESRALDNAVETGRGKQKKEMKKKLKILIPLVLLAKVKAVIAVVVSLVVIAISLAKIALLAKLAFLAKVIALIKALIAKKHQHEEEQWVSHAAPPEHGHGGGWESGWSRSRNEGNNLAYSAYAQ